MFWRLRPLFWWGATLQYRLDKRITILIEVLLHTQTPNVLTYILQPLKELLVTLSRCLRQLFRTVYYV